MILLFYTGILWERGRLIRIRSEPDLFELMSAEAVTRLHHQNYGKYIHLPTVNMKLYFFTFMYQDSMGTGTFGNKYYI